ncbi:MAG: PAS domain S-box protein [Gammaproteobacteria bacterium]|nr:PAS domain S-box protein [Gammaproteobacteria bacterium]
MAMINASILAYAQWSVIDHLTIQLWLAVVLIIYFLRVVTTFVYKKTTPSLNDDQRWLGLAQTGILLSGIIWGSTAIFLFPENDIVHQTFIAFVIAGMGAAAVTTLSVRLEVAMMFIIPAVLPLIIRLLMEDTSISYLMAFMVTFYLIVISGSVSRFHRNTLTNITLRLQSSHREKDLEESEARFRLLVDNAVDAIFLHDEDGNFIDVNHQACVSLGYTREELLKMSVFDIEKGVTRSKLGDFWSSLDKNKPFRLEGVQQRKDGTLFPVEVNLGFLEKKGKNLVLASVRDITQRKLNEDILRKSNQKLALHVQQTPLAVIEWNTDWEVVEWNPAAENIFGYTYEEAHGRHAIELIVPEIAREHVDEIWDALLKQKGGLRSSNDNVTKSGKIITCEWYNTPLIDEEQNVIGVASLVQDITERKHAEEALLKAKEEAEYANNAKSEFLSSMSHELRTPLNAIIGFGQIIKLEVKNKEQEQYVDEILKAGEHLLSLINTVLDLSRIETGTMDFSMHNISLNSVLIDAITLIKPLMDKKGITFIDKTEQQKDYVVQVDPVRLKQAIINLLSNAVKYNKKQGQILLRTDETDDGKLRISIEDTGQGLTAEQLERLFTSFDRLGKEKSNIEGTGIGLVITKHIMKMMNGSVGVKSIPDHGSCFWLEVMLGDNAEEALSEPKQLNNETVVTNDNQHTVLYIEDNAANLKLVELIIRKKSAFNMLSAMTPEEGIELANIHQPDLILLDINLPGMNGYEVYSYLQENERTKHIPVIGISANAMQKDIDRAMNAGFSDYITKPINATQLLDSIDTVFK